MDKSIIFKEFKKLLDQKQIIELKNKSTLHLQNNPNDLFAIEFLGISQFILKEFKESSQTFKIALGIDKDSTTSLLHLARISNIFKDYNTANTFYSKLIEVEKKNYFYFIEYASFLIHIKKINNAISVLNNSIKINEKLFNAYSLLGLIFLQADKFANAISYYNKSLECNPKNPKDLSNIGYCYYKLEKINKSKYYFLKSIEVDSNFSIAYSNLGLAHQTEGNFIEAISSYKKCLEINPNDCETYRLLSMTTKLDLKDIHVKNMVKIFSSTISSSDKISLGFALAKVMDDNKKYSESAMYLDQANKLRRDGFFKFNITQVEEQFTLIERTFTHSFFLKNNASFDREITPIFILGMPRSGTTLTEQILSNHPKVHGCGEINDLTDSINEYFPELDSALMLENIFRASRDLFKNIGNKYISSLKKYSNTKLFFTDKMPFNFKVIGLIKVCLPNAKIIHCYRNPNDNLLSIYKNNFSKDIMPWAYSQSELKKYYKLYNKLMEHYKKVLGGFIYNFDYDILTKNPEQEILKLVKFCNLDWNDACLKVEQNNKPIFTASINQAREKIHTDSYNSWKKFENYFPDLFL